MTKILKKVQLSAEQSTPMSADPTKGTQTNPYTQVEMAQLQEAGAWNGGYVEGMGYIVPMMSMLDNLSVNYPTYPLQDGFLAQLENDTFYFFGNDDSYLILPGVWFDLGPVDDINGRFGDLNDIHNFAELSDLYGHYGTTEYSDINGYIIPNHQSTYGAWADEIYHELDNCTNYDELFPDVCHRLGLGYAERYTRHDAIIRP
jgi:hypothetical protein